MDPGLLPKEYTPIQPRKETALAADAVKQFMEDRLRSDLNVFKHTSPLAFVHGTGASPPTYQFVAHHKELPPRAIQSSDNGLAQV